MQKRLKNTVLGDLGFHNPIEIIVGDSWLRPQILEFLLVQVLNVNFYPLDTPMQY